MEFRVVDDFFTEWDDCAVDSKFFDSVVRSSADEAGPSLKAECLDASKNEESSCSSAPSFVSGQSINSEVCSFPLPEGELPCLEAHADEGAQILAADPLLKTFLEAGRQGVSRCFFFRSPANPFLVVAQSLDAIVSGRRFYDNLNMLEGLGVLKRGPVSCIEGSRHRFFTWFGNIFMTEDFRCLLRHGEKTGLVAAVRAVEAGRTPAVDRFTCAVTIARQEATSYAIERRKPRGKCPLNVGIQRVLVILLAARRPLSIEAIVLLLQLPFPDVSLQRRFFYIRELLINFELARVPKVDDVKQSCFEYCGPSLGTTLVPQLVPLFLLKENVLRPLCLKVNGQPPQPPQPPEPLFCSGDLPASLLDARELSENLPPCPDEEEEDDLLMRSNSNASSVLRRTDTLLPWTNSN